MQLVICEKPSQARDIASAIGATKRGNGFIEGQNVIVTWCIGHLVTHAPMDLYDESLKKWSLDTLPFIPESFRLEAVSTAKSQFKVVKDLLKDSKITDIVNATDAGREGELIFDLVYRKSGCKKNTLRLWTASLTKEAILEAWRNLKPSSDYSGLRDAARCRAESDWIIGLNATRAQTVVARSNGHKGVYSVGRVQTPTLAMIVNREQEITNFVSKDFYTVHAKFSSKKGSFEGQWFKKDDKSINRFFREEEAKNLIEQTKNASAKIDSIETKTEKKKAPLLFDLTSLQREANQRFGMTAAETLSIAQSLYETHKVLSYPRTNSRYLTKGEGDKLPEILGCLKQDSRYTEFSLYITGKSTPPRFVNDKKVEDHHAIIPTGSVVNNLSDSEQKIFNMVALRSFAAFYEDRIDEVTRIVTLIGSEPFLTTGRVIKNPGWNIVEKDSDQKKCEPLLPALTEQDSVETSGLDIKKGKTKPASRYTEASLLASMESAGKQVEDEELSEALKDHGLGTPATRAAIIEQLKKRQYIESKGKTLQPTENGIQLIKMVPSEALKSPALTGDWEHKLNLMQRGEYQRSTFMAEVSDYAQSIILDISKAYNKDYSPSGKASVLGSCPKCQKDLLLKEWEGKSYVRCSAKDCKVFYYADPKGSPLGGNCQKCQGPVSITKNGSKVCAVCNSWQTQTLGKCLKCQKGSYTLRSWQGQHYAKCSDTECKSSYPTSKDGKPKKKCKPCKAPLFITRDGNGVCVSCGTWENKKKTRA